LLRSGIAALVGTQPDMRMVGEASHGNEAVQLHRELNPDVTLMNLQMPDMSGLDAIISIRTEQPSARIIVLTTYAGDVLAPQCFFYHERAARWLRLVPERRPSIRRERASARRA